MVVAALVVAAHAWHNSRKLAGGWPRQQCTTLCAPAPCTLAARSRGTHRALEAAVVLLPVVGKVRVRLLRLVGVGGRRGAEHGAAGSTGGGLLMLGESSQAGLVLAQQGSQWPLKTSGGGAAGDARRRAGRHRRDQAASAHFDAGRGGGEGCGRRSRWG